MRYLYTQFNFINLLLFLPPACLLLCMCLCFEIFFRLLDVALLTKISNELHDVTRLFCILLVY